MNRAETAKLVTVLQASYPAVRIDAQRASDMISAWSDLLGDLPYDQVNAAVRQLLQTRTFMPSVAEIRSGCAQLALGRVRSGGEAWGGVAAAMRQEGAYRTPGTEFVFSDPITARCVQVMDWQTLCLSSNTVADRARFIELYDHLSRDHRAEIASPALKGQLIAGMFPEPVAE